MAEKVLSLFMQDELNLRLRFLEDAIRVLSEARELVIGDVEILLWNVENIISEIRGILSGKEIIPRNDDTVFGWNGRGC